MVTRIDSIYKAVLASTEKCKELYKEATDEYMSVCDYIGEAKDEANVENMVQQLSSVVTMIEAAMQAAIARSKKKGRSGGVPDK